MEGVCFDVNCVLDDGTQIDLEMQASRIQEDMDGSYQNLKGKSIYYLCDLHSSQSAKGLRRYDKLAHSYQVTFCSYTVFPNRPEFVNSFSLRHDEDNELLSDAIRIIYVELSKLQEIIKKSVADMTDLEKWAVFFQYASEQQARETVNEVIASKEALQMAGDLLMSISKDERERAVFRSRRMYQTDLASDLATAEDRGIKIGERRGMEKGIEIGERRGIEIGERRGMEVGVRNSRIEFAQRLLRRNRSVDEIAEDTGLSVEDVEELKAKNRGHE